MKEAKNIVNLVTGNMSPGDKKETLSGIEKNTEDRKIFYKVKAAWAVLSSTKKMQDYEIEKNYLQLKNRIDRQNKQVPFTTGTFLKYAAILVILVGLPVLFYLNKPHSPGEIAEELRYTSVVAGYGQISKVILPDSSVVWINSGTTLSYNSGYSINNRNLILEGQAYLDVKKDRKNPLIVACANLKVKVLGTKFDVCAYPGDDMINVVLESGSVELLQPGNTSFNYTLKPGEIAQYNVQQNNIVIKKADTAGLTDWKEGYLIFKDTPMADVIERLERKFGVAVTVKNREVYKSIFNANFRNESLKEILDYIEYSCPIKYRMLKENNIDKPIVELYAGSD